jgi:hypothetical protein
VILPLRRPFTPRPIAIRQLHTHLFGCLAEPMRGCEPLHRRKDAPRPSRLRCPTIQNFILGRTPRAGEAYALVLMAVRALLPRMDTKDTPLVEMTAELERVLFSKQAALQAAANEAGATASTIVGAVIRETGALRSAAAAAVPGTTSLTLGSGAPASIGGDAIEEALSSSAYVTFRDAVAKCDLLSASGRREAFEAATGGDCILLTRMIMFGETALAKRHGSLGTLLYLRAFLSEWFTYSVAVDSSGGIPLALAKWSITPTDSRGVQTTFLDSFLKGELSTIDWLGSHNTPGLLHYLSSLESRNIAAIHPSDHLCDPTILAALADFGQSLFSALGYPATPPPPTFGGPAGYSWKTWWEFYASVVKVARTLPNREAQLDWLDDCHDVGLSSLKLMQQLMLGEVRATENLRDRRLHVVLPFDCQPAEYLRTKLEHFSEDQAWERRTRPFGRGGSSSQTLHNIHELPLRSWRHKKRPLEKPKLRGGKPRLEAQDTQCSDKQDDETEAPGGDEVVDARTRGGEERKPGNIPTAWIKPGELLFVSGLVWDVKKLAAKLGVTPVTAKCWPFLLSRKQGANRLRLDCLEQKKGEVPAAHASADAAAHKLKDFELGDFLSEYSRYPSPEELATVKAALPGLQRNGRSNGRGGRSGGPPFRRPSRA